MPSPFGIRRRLKALFGMGEKAAPVREEVPKVSLTVVGPDGAEQSCQTDVGNSVVSASNRMKRPIATGCSDSTCGTCRIEVLEGADNVVEQSARERATLKDNGYPATLRLGCRTELVKGSVKVKAFELT
jgi:ferredoxin